MRSIKPPTLEDIPHGLDVRLTQLLEGIVRTLDLREGRVADATNARFARQEDRLVKEVVYTNRTGITAVIPFDNTVPQNTEGTEILVATITPKRIVHRLRIEFEIWGQASGGVTGVVGALFKDAGADAIYATALTLATDYVGTVVGRHEMGLNSLNEVTFTVRVGVSANTFYTNGLAANPAFGVVQQACRLRIMELPSE
jgi:hypothetical protein